MVRSVAEPTFSDLRRHPGYPSFYVTATLTRLADEMFSVGAVLLILERTGSAALAGATIAAITLPSVVTGPVLGAWLDRSGARRRVMMLDQVLAATTLVAIVVLAGHAPSWTIPVVALGAGMTWPLSFGGFTSLIPVIVPDRLLPRANALEATSFNVAVIGGPALAGTISALAGPATSLLVEAALTVGAIGLIAMIPSVDVGAAGTHRTLGEIVNAGLRHLAATPPLRAVTVRRRIEPRWPRAADGRVSILCDRRSRGQPRRRWLPVGRVCVRVDGRRPLARSTSDSLAAGAGGAGLAHCVGPHDAVVAACVGGTGRARSDRACRLR
jgi:MFS family permease